jgi:hypothetical protein
MSCTPHVGSVSSAIDTIISWMSDVEVNGGSDTVLSLSNAPAETLTKLMQLLNSGGGKGELNSGNVRLGTSITAEGTEVTGHNAYKAAIFDVPIDDSTFEYEVLIKECGRGDERCDYSFYGSS